MKVNVNEIKVKDCIEGGIANIKEEVMLIVKSDNSEEVFNSIAEIDMHLGVFFDLATSLSDEITLLRSEVKRLEEENCDTSGLVSIFSQVLDTNKAIAEAFKAAVDELNKKG